ncbi:MAG: A24 family peptidase [Planctomycetota bacterium]|jgi:prepilin peptidase CpaA
MLATSGAWWSHWAYYVLAIVLVAASYTDVRDGKIPYYITYPGVLVGLIGHAITGGLTGRGELAIGLSGSALGLAVGFLPWALVWQVGLIGGGDAKVMGAIGALSGWRFTLAATFYGFAAALVMAIIVMVARRITVRTLKRVWRTLVLVFTPGGEMKPVTEGSPTIPLGLAFCIGAAAALLEVMWRGPAAEKLALWW